MIDEDNFLEKRDQSMTRRNSSETPKDTTKKKQRSEASPTEDTSLVDSLQLIPMPGSEIVKLARSRPKPYQPRRPEKTSPKKTSVKESWAHEYGRLYVEAMENIDWRNPPIVKPEKPLFPPPGKKTSNQVNVGIDPEMFSLGIELACFHIEAGACSFIKYAKAVIADLGPNAKPFLKVWYSVIRHYPGMNIEGMDTLTTVEAIDIDDLFPTEGQAGLEKRSSPTRTESDKFNIELTDSLYEKLKIRLVEIVRRARRKDLDVKSYLFGAVDSYPEGPLKRLYEIASERYFRDMEVSRQKNHENYIKRHQLINEANKHPLNQAALKAMGGLVQSGWGPGTNIHALELASWGMEERGLKVREEVEMEVYRLMGVDPRLVMLLLTRIVEGPEENLEEAEEIDLLAMVQGPEPEDLAWSILDQLESVWTNVNISPL